MSRLGKFRLSLSQSVSYFKTYAGRHDDRPRDNRFCVILRMSNEGVIEIFDLFNLVLSLNLTELFVLQVFCNHVLFVRRC